MIKTFDSKWLRVRAEDNELTLELTAEGGRRLQAMLISSTLEGADRITKWKVSEAFVLASLFGDFVEDTAVSVAEAWIDLKDKNLISSILEQMLWEDGKVVLAREV